MLAPSPAGDDKQAPTATSAEGAAPGGSGACWGARLGTALYGLLRRRQLWVAAILLGLVAAGGVLGRPHLLAWYHFRAGRSELQRYHTREADRHLQACLRVWPEDADALLLAARAARRARSYSEAEGFLEKYQQARGLDDAGSLEQLLLSAERRVDRVGDQCWRYVEQGHPDTPLILEALTRGHFRQYRLRQARLCLDRWLQNQPDNPQAHYLDGQFQLDFKRDKSAAEASFRRAVELDPDHEEARLSLAVALLGSDHFAEAAEHLEYVRQRQPDNLSVQVGLAECRDGLDEVTQAVELVDQVLAQRPDYPPALALRGRLAVKQGDFARGETWLRQALSADPSVHLARYNLILCLHSNGKKEEAKQQERQLKQTDDDLQRYHEIVTRDLLQRPHDPALHCELGQLLLRGGKQEEGLRWLQSALHLDPQYAPARQALAEYQKAATKPPQQN